MIRNGGAVAGARFAAPQPLALGETMAPEIVAEACGLAAGDVETRHRRRGSRAAARPSCSPS